MVTTTILNSTAYFYRYLYNGFRMTKIANIFLWCCLCLKEIEQLNKIGIKTIINLRLWHSDRNKLTNTGIAEIRINMRAGKVTDEKIIQILKAIKNSPKPILIHCWHGSDRTGVVIAMYRLIFQNWTKKQVIDELMKPELEHHYNVYPNIQRYIEDADVEKIRQAVFE